MVVGRNKMLVSQAEISNQAEFDHVFTFVARVDVEF